MPLKPRRKPVRMPPKKMIMFMVNSSLQAIKIRLE
jgi:hypothetical protein